MLTQESAVPRTHADQLGATAGALPKQVCVPGGTGTGTAQILCGHGTAHGTRRTAHGTHGTRRTAHGTRHTAHGARRTAHGTRHTAHDGTHSVMLKTWSLLNTWRYLGVQGRVRCRGGQVGGRKG